MSVGLSPAEQRATDEGLPTVAVIVHELLNVASGHPIITRTLDGSEVLLRLPTADEVMRFNRDAIATLPEGVRPEPISRSRAEELSAPMRIPGWSS